MPDFWRLGAISIRKITLEYQDLKIYLYDFVFLSMTDARSKYVYRTV